MPLPAADPRFQPAVLPPSVPSPRAWWFAFAGGQLLLPDGGAAAPGTDPGAAAWAQAAGELAALLRDGTGISPAEWLAAGAPADGPLPHYLGRLDGHDCWALALPQRPPGWRALPLRSAMLQLPDALGALAGRAAQVLEWDRSHRFCSACGSPTQPHARDRARQCPACGHTAYPRLSPAMMALVWRPGELLLARSPHYAKGMYSALAGFVEAGESLEDCLHREVAEEVGLQVQAPVYYGSQSWPFPHSLMVAYTARWAGGEIVPQPGEIEDAQWFPIDALPPLPPPLSIAGHLIRDTVQAMREGRWPAG